MFKEVAVSKIVIILSALVLLVSCTTPERNRLYKEKQIRQASIDFYSKIRHYNRHKDKASLVILSIVSNDDEFNFTKCNLGGYPDAQYMLPSEEYFVENKNKSINVFYSTSDFKKIESIECWGYPRLNKLQLGKQYLKIKPEIGSVVYAGEIEIHRVKPSIFSEEKFAIKIKDNKFSDLMHFNKIASSNINHNDVITKLAEQKGLVTIDTRTVPKRKKALEFNGKGKIKNPDSGLDFRYESLIDKY